MAYVPKTIEEKEYLDNYDSNKYPKPCVTVDMILTYNSKILLIQRKNFPYKGCWALPGGFLDVGKENTFEAAMREVQEETSVHLKQTQVRLFDVYSNPDRDPRDHVVSIVYVAELSKEQAESVKANDDAAVTTWYDRYQIAMLQIDRQLAFDHSTILDDYLYFY